MCKWKKSPEKWQHPICRFVCHFVWTSCILEAHTRTQEEKVTNNCILKGWKNEISWKMFRAKKISICRFNCFCDRAFINPMTKGNEHRTVSQFAVCFSLAFLIYLTQFDYFPKLIVRQEKISDEKNLQRQEKFNRNKRKQLQLDVFFICFYWINNQCFCVIR